ncbi:MAG: hypothetical protein ACLUSL_13255 [Ruminococcus sp.]
MEVRSDADLVEVHEVVDTIEREIYEKLHILMTIHMDPIEQDNPQVNACRALVGQIIGEMQLGLSFHDFRMVAGDSSCKMIFDVVVPFGCKCKNQQLQDRIVEALPAARRGVPGGHHVRPGLYRLRIAFAPAMGRTLFVYQNIFCRKIILQRPHFCGILRVYSKNQFCFRK